MDGATYICVKQFNARLGDELSLKIGDKIQVLADDREYNDGWYMGKNLLTGDVGLYPKTFTQILANGEEKTLLRSRSRRVMTPPTKVHANGNGNVINNKSANNNNNNNNSNSSTTTTTTTAAAAAATDSYESDSRLGETFNKLNISGSHSFSSYHMNSEIDKALEEIQNPGYQKQFKPVKQANSTANGTSSHSRTVSTRSLTDDLNPLFANTWTAKQVSSYFALVLGFDRTVANKFAKHKITGSILFELDLAHLKELEIDSFGTRFEIHKEIEKLREMAARSAKLKQSRTNSQSTGSTNKNDTTQTTLNSSPTDTTAFPLEDDKSKLLSSSVSSQYNNLMPSAFSEPTSKHQRKRSQSMINISQADSSFMSPRKAPEPPGDESPINTNFKFGTGTGTGTGATTSSSTITEPHYGLYMTRKNASSHALASSPRPPSSIYDQGSHYRQGSSSSNHRQYKSPQSNHKRHSSLFSFLSNGNDGSSAAAGVAGSASATPLQTSNGKFQSNNIKKNDDKLISPPHIKRENGSTTPRKSQIFDFSSPVDIDDANLSPKKSDSVKIKSNSIDALKDDRRIASDPQPPTRPGTSRLKSLRTTSTQNFRNLTGSKKSKTSAFTEGIRDITPEEAIKTAGYSGYMSKRSGNTFAWRTRYFTLHGTRLSYFSSLKDKKEKGLIDITAHKVIPINVNAEDVEKADKYAAMVASTTFAGNYCFKIVPPAPGFKKGLTFTQPKIHYFAVESENEMRGWIKALMTATIDIDDSVPVVSSCSTPTVSLIKAQELLAKAREENKLKDEELRAKGYIRGDEEFINDSSFQSSMYSSSTLAPESTRGPSLTIDTTNRKSSTSNTATHSVTATQASVAPLTPQIARSVSSSQGGFASPYLLASGYMSPKSSSPGGTPATVNSGHFGDIPSSFKPPSSRNSQQTKNQARGTISSTPYSTASSSNNSQINIDSPSDKSPMINTSTSNSSSAPSAVAAAAARTVLANSTGKLLSGSKK
ncbi:BOI2 [Candida oxycetoniae]|uniref:BOI2 n=1 Tax=Candida oxycetoniae TaxID=497107 RepID=A0AAI9SWE9_9ASCO|nr:BOI2 [Candida oxycetoniae]KAI3404027.2 BOI2 [Candida oxycetoniae]